MTDMEFERLEEGLYRLCVPFEEIYTSVFLLRTGAGDILLDGAASAQDARRYVLPALKAMGARPVLIVRSHSHGDHSGGVEELAAHFPQAQIALAEDGFPDNGKYRRLYDGDVLLERFQVLNLKGHTDDCVALFDLCSRTLLSGDCLQAGGIGKYGVSFTDPAAYLQSVERVRRLDPAHIVAAHAFVPYGFRATGAEGVRAYLDACIIR